MKRLILLLALVFIPLASAVVGNIEEDWESYALTTMDPDTSDAWSWSGTGDVEVISTVVADTGSQALFFDNGDSDQDKFIELTAATAAVGASIWLEPVADTGIEFRITGDGTLVELDIEVTGRVSVFGGGSTLIGAGNPCDIRREFVFTFDYTAQTYDWDITDYQGTNCGSGTQPFVTASTEIQRIRFRPMDLPDLSTARIDDWSITTVLPEAPAGVEGYTSEADADTFTIAWLLSDDDPDPENGAYNYTLKADNGGGYTDVTTIPAGDAVDGVMTWEGVVSTSADVEFKVTATNTTTGIESGDSCIITLDSEVQDDFGSCGDDVSLVIDTGSDLTDEDGALFGGNKQALADSLQVSVASIEFIMGVLLTLVLMAGGWKYGGGMGAIGMLIPGLILSYSIGLFPFWSIYVGGFLLVAGVILAMKSRGSLSGS